MTFLIFLYEQKRKERILMLEQWIKENANMKDRGSVAVINDDVWILPPRCFSNMPGFKKVILPYNLRKIGAFSFAGCRSLEVIDIPRQVVLIDYGAFYGCCSLKAINLPDRVVGIGSMAFAGTNLSTITLPKSVRYIDDGAFADCPRINQISLPENLYDIPYEKRSMIFVSNPDIIPSCD